MSANRPRRSALYMPASNARAIEKARSLPCDVVILDLEDAVAPDLKAQARAQAVEAARAGGFGARELVIRVNGLDTPWGADDLAAVSGSGADAILAPKVDDATMVREYDRALVSAAPAMQLWVMIETARSVLRLADIASAVADTRLGAFVLGTNDLAKEMDAVLDVGRAPFLGFMALAVAAAKSERLAILDGVYNAIDDEEGFAQQCRQAIAYGFSGKTLIHPRQIDPCNQLFSPSQEKLAWAHLVIEAFARPENQDRGAIQVNGQMVERLHLSQAERLLASTRPE